MSLYSLSAAYWLLGRIERARKRSDLISECY
jgi:hypothetical protein